MSESGDIRVRVSAPQPLSIKKGEYAAVGMHAVAMTDPALRALAMRIVAGWSDVDVVWPHILSALLTTTHERWIMTDAWIALQSDGPKSVLLEVAERKLPSDKRGLIGRVRKAISPAKKRRDALAHHLWVHSPSAPELLALLDPAVPVKYAAFGEPMHAAAIRMRGFARGGAIRSSAYSLDHSSARAAVAFAKADLERDVMAIEESLNLVNLLEDAVTRNPESESALQRLMTALKST